MHQCQKPNLRREHSQCLLTDLKFGMAEKIDCLGILNPIIYNDYDLKYRHRYLKHKTPDCIITRIVRKLSSVLEIYSYEKVLSIFLSPFFRVKL